MMERRNGRRGEISLQYSNLIIRRKDPAAGNGKVRRQQRQQSLSTLCGTSPLALSLPCFLVELWYSSHPTMYSSFCLLIMLLKIRLTKETLEPEMVRTANVCKVSLLPSFFPALLYSCSAYLQPFTLFILLTFHTAQEFAAANFISRVSKLYRSTPGFLFGFKVPVPQALRYSYYLLSPPPLLSFSSLSLPLPPLVLLPLSCPSPC